MRSVVSIDVDSLRLYSDIHGLAAPALEADPIYTCAMPRFWELMAGRPATVFLIGRDAPRYAEQFAPALDSGSEIGSHSFAHDYRLSQRSPAAIHADLAAAEAALTPLNGGRPPRGFRAPGYNVSPALLHALVERGYAYDSSLLPSPAYWGARAAALAWYRLRGRSSHSLRGDPRAYAGSRHAYRTTPHRYWRRAADGPLLEVPMLVDPVLRLPIIGTSWVLWPRSFRDALLDRVLRGGHDIVFELHAIDLLDPADPGVHPELTAAQPDLRQAAPSKFDALRQLVERLQAQTELTTLAALADQYKG